MLLTVRHPETRKHAAEAVAAYRAGALRLALVGAWVAVVIDLIHKVEVLAKDGNGDADRFAQRIHRCRAQRDSAREMNFIEAEIVDAAARFELVDSTETEHLQRLRADRHRCAHPGLHGDDSYFQPSAELVRAHLAAAFDATWSQAPMQGRQALQRVLQILTDPLFIPSSSNVITEGVYLHAATGTQRRVLTVLAKHAILELPVDVADLSNVELADRAAVVLNDLLVTDRKQVAQAITDVLNDARVGTLDSRALLRLTGRLGRMYEYWQGLPGHLRDHIESLIVHAELEVIHDNKLFELIGHPGLPRFVSDLEARLAELDLPNRVDLLSRASSTLQASNSAALLSAAGWFRQAETIMRVVVCPAISTVSADQVDSIFNAIGQNTQCLFAADMPDLLHVFSLGSHERNILSDATLRSFLATARQQRVKFQQHQRYDYTSLERFLDPPDSRSVD